MNDTLNELSTTDPKRVRLSRDQRGQLVLHRDGEADVAGVRVARCFPWTCPDEYLSIRDKDGNEVALLAAWSGAAEETRRMIDEELAAQEFFPRITRVVEVDDRFDVMSWKVETDRGVIELQVQHHEDIRMRDDGRVTIKDHSGGLFVVDDLFALDLASRRHIEDRLA